MQDLTDHFVELIRRTSTDLPADVETALRRALETEAAGSAAQGALDSILENVALARAKPAPICQDTGTPIFSVQHPEGWSTRRLREQIRAAVAEATRQAYLRPNAVDSLSDKNSGNNLGDAAFPTIHFEEIEGDTLTVDLLLKGGGCENVGAQYSLPHGTLEPARPSTPCRPGRRSQARAGMRRGIRRGRRRRPSSSYARPRPFAPVGRSKRVHAGEWKPSNGEANQLGSGRWGSAGRRPCSGSKWPGCIGSRQASS
jgi:hypothetical protein